MSAFTHFLIYLGPLTALVGVIAGAYCKISRARLLRRAGDIALEKGSKSPRGKAGLTIVRALTSDDEPWYLKALPWRRPGDGQS